MLFPCLITFVVFFRLFCCGVLLCVYYVFGLFCYLWCFGFLCFAVARVATSVLAEGGLRLGFVLIDGVFYLGVIVCVWGCAGCLLLVLLCLILRVCCARFVCEFGLLAVDTWFGC